MNYFRQALLLVGLMTIPFSIVAQKFSGKYTVDTTGGGNFTSIQQASDSLSGRGVDDKVTIAIKPGVYDGEINIDSIPGTSASNTVTFKSSTGDSADVKLIRSASSNGDTLSTIEINSTDHLYIEDITIKGKQEVNGIRIHGTARNIHLERSNLLSDRVGIIVENVGYKEGFFNAPYRIEVVKGVKIVDNRIRAHGGIFLRHNGSFSDLRGLNKSILHNYITSDVTIHNNKIMSSGRAPIYVASANHIDITNNTITAKNVYLSSANSIECRNYLNDFKIRKNKISSSYGGIVIGITAYQDSIPDKGMIANNFISAYQSALHLTGTKKTKIYFNSINLREKNLTQTPHAVSLCESCIYYNNIFATQSDKGWLIDYNSSRVTDITSNNNVFYTNNTGHFAIDYSDNDTLKNLTEYRNKMGTDANSFAAEPPYKSATDLHLTTKAFKDSGRSVQAINKDIDGEKRNSGNPDIGADEIVKTTNMVPHEIDIFSDTLPKDNTIKITYKVKNTSTNAISGSWNDGLYLSADQNLDKKDTFLTGIQNDFGLSPSDTYSHDTLIALPEDTSGKYYIILNVDYRGETYDDTSDNVLSSGDQFVIANMVPRKIEISSDSTFSGHPFQVTYQAQNTGFTILRDTWRDALYLSADQQLDKQDTLLTSVLNEKDLSQSETYEQSPTFTIPEDTTGPHHLILDINQHNNNFEDTSDNLLTSSESVVLELSPRPDLSVERISVPNSINSGKQLTIEWEVKNKGDTATQQIWSDYIYVAGDSTAFNDSSQLPDSLFVKKIQAPVGLKPGETYTNSVRTEIPMVASGTRFIKVVSDGGKSIAEKKEGHQDNGNISAGLTVRQSPLANLVVKDVTIQPTGFSGEHVSMRYTVQNIGNAPTLKDHWKDRILLFGDSTMNMEKHVNENERGEYNHNGQLEPDSSYTVSDSVFLGRCVADTFSVYVQTDYFNEVLELKDEDNLKGPDTVEAVLEPKPDLIVENLDIHTASPHSGKKLTVSYEVKNDGFKKADHYKKWFDRVYLDKHSNFNMESAQQLGGFAGKSELDKDSSYTVNKTFTVPDSIHGNYYLYVYTDRSNEICEAPHEGNNITSTQNRINIQLTPPPDLKVKSLPEAKGKKTGQDLSVRYEVENAGQGKTPENEWNDKVYLQKKGEPLKKAYELVNNEHTGKLEAGNSYSFERKENLPLELDTGSYRLTFKLDNNKEVYEYTGESNNIQYTEYFDITYDTSEVSDLAVKDLDYNGKARSGKKIQVKYTITNHSAQTNENSWYDQINLINQNDKIIMDKEAPHFGNLEKGEEVTRTIGFTLPHGKQGDYQLTVESDTTQRILDYNRSNNKDSLTLNISLSPSPDLQISSATTSDSVNAGQMHSVQYIIENKGAGPTFDTTWIDKVYLSKDTILDSGDYLVASSEISKSLSVGDSYRDTASFRVPLYISGNYYILLKADEANDLYEGSWEKNNTEYVSPQIYVHRPNPSDLAAGDSAMEYHLNSDYLEYHVQNLNSNKARGSWTDAIYLSSDSLWDKDDPKIGEAEHDSMNLGRDESYNNSLFGDVPMVEPGYYRIIVKADAFNYIPEVNSINNYIVSADSFYIDETQPLKLDSAYNQSFTESDPNDYFRVKRPRDKGMIVKLTPSNQEASTELYHKTESIPKRVNYDTKYNNPHQPNQKLIVPTTKKPVTDYLFSHLAYPEASEYSIEAKSASFSISDIYPQKGGEYGIVTPHIRGIDFTEGTSFQLRSNEDTIKSMHVFRESLTSAAAHFDLREHETGSYDVVAVKPTGEEAVLEDGFEIAPEGFPRHYVEVLQPSLARPGRKSQVSVQFGNRGLVNNYDVWLVVAFANDSLQSDNLEVHYKGSSIDKYYETPDNHPYPPNDSNIIEAEGIKYFALHIPLLPAKGQGDLSFEITSKKEDSTFTYAYMVRQPLSKFSFSGKFKDMDHMVTLKEIAAQFYNNSDTTQTTTAGKKGRAKLKKTYSCDNFNYDNIKGDMVQSVKETAQRVHPSRITAEAGNDLFEKSRNHFIGKVKSAAKSQTKKQIKEYYTEEKSWGDMVSDWWSGTKDEVDPTTGTPWDKYLNTIDKCIKNEVSEEELAECVHSTKLPDGTIHYSIYDFCKKDNGDGDEGDNQGDGDGGTTNHQEAKDPNKIVGPDGVTDMRFIRTSKKLVYKIFFENKPGAEVPAQEVIISNPLQEDFRLQDMELQSFGFGDTTINLPATNNLDKTINLGPKYGNNQLQIVAGLNVIKSEAFWRLTTIDPSTGQKTTDPSGGFLPPNDSTGRGEGFVKYEIAIEEEAQPGTEISNQATIRFDKAKKIKTNTWTNVIAGSDPMSEVKDLPSNVDSTTFPVEWEGISGSKFGTGVSHYDIYYAVNDSVYQPWISSTTENRSQFRGKRGKTYDFISIAYSKDGTKEVRPDSADATIHISDTTSSGDDGDSDDETAINKNKIKEEKNNPDLSIQPNPSEGLTTIGISLDKPRRIRLSILNLQGNKIRNLYSGTKKEGNHRFLFNAKKLQKTGIFLIHLDYRGGRITKELFVSP